MYLAQAFVCAGFMAAVADATPALRVEIRLEHKGDVFGQGGEWDRQYAREALQILKDLRPDTTWAARLEALGDNTWMQARAVGPQQVEGGRSEVPMFYVPDIHASILCCGCTSPGYSSDTWAYHTGANRWVQMWPNFIKGAAAGRLNKGPTPRDRPWTRCSLGLAGDGRNEVVFGRTGLCMMASSALPAAGPSAATVDGPAAPKGPETPYRTSQRARRAGPLKELPSAPGAHIERIKALGDNRWLDLGSPAPDPTWGKALGRSYSPRMVYLPQHRAAFLAGQGVHGGMKKGGLYQDEVFAYDINAHRWVCIYPGSDVNALALRLDRHGFEVNDQGEHVPVAILGHGHHLFTYDGHRNAVVIIPLGNTWWEQAFPRRREWLDERAPTWLRNPRHPWLFHLDTGRWEHRFVEGEGPGPRQYFSVVEYLPSKRQTFFLDRGCRSWLYDSAANRWSAAKTPATPLAGYDWNGCLDTKRERVLVGQGKDLLAYDARADDWRKCAAPPDGAFFGNSTTNAITYDAANDVVVLGMMHSGSGITKESPGKGRLYFYRPESDMWEKASTPLPSWSGVVNAFYDPELNAHFFHVARDSTANGTIFVYRYRGPRGTEKERTP